MRLHQYPPTFFTYSRHRPLIPALGFPTREPAHCTLIDSTTVFRFARAPIMSSSWPEMPNPPTGADGSTIFPRDHDGTSIDSSASIGRREGIRPMCPRLKGMCPFRPSPGCPDARDTAARGPSPYVRTNKRWFVRWYRSDAPMTSYVSFMTFASDRRPRILTHLYVSRRLRSFFLTDRYNAPAPGVVTRCARHQSRVPNPASTTQPIAPKRDSGAKHVRAGARRLSALTERSGRKLISPRRFQAVRV